MLHSQGLWYIIGDAAVGKSSLLVRLTDQRFLANPDPTVGFIHFWNGFYLSGWNVHLLFFRFLDTPVFRLVWSLDRNWLLFPKITRWWSCNVSVKLLHVNLVYYRCHTGLLPLIKCWQQLIRLGHCRPRIISRNNTFLLPWSCRLSTRVRRDVAEKSVFSKEKTSVASCNLNWRCRLVYSLGFLNARSWLAEVREHADPNVSCILVGNKVDLCEDPTLALPAAAGTSLTSTSSPNPTVSHIRSVRGKHTTSQSKAREVTYAEAEQWAKDEGMLFVEASAKSGLNVEQAFVDASCDILAKVKQGVFNEDRVRLLYYL